jgi:hypothetical protein
MTGFHLSILTEYEISRAVKSKIIHTKSPFDKKYIMMTGKGDFNLPFEKNKNIGY